ncbi:MAG TPA: sugar ABC transporter permease [Cytophagaceae bacterium]
MVNFKSIDERKITKVIFLLPAILIVGLFMFYPALSGFYLSFTDWNGITKTIDYIGVRNFLEMFQDRVFYSSVKNTIIYCLLTVIIQHTIALSLAVVIDKGLKGSEFYKVVLFIPCLLSTIVTGMIFSLIFSPINGSFNAILESIGLKSLTRDWLGDGNIVLYVVIATGIWQWIGYAMVIYIAGLQTIPQDLIEASDIDGANAWKKFIHVEFPCIAPAFTINTVLSVIGSLKSFELVYSMTGGGPGNASEVIATYIYKVGFTSSRMGYGTAVSLFLFIMIVAVSFIQTKLLRSREVEL